MARSNAAAGNGQATISSSKLAPAPSTTTCPPRWAASINRFNDSHGTANRPPRGDGDIQIVRPGVPTGTNSMPATVPAKDDAAAETFSEASWMAELRGMFGIAGRLAFVIRANLRAVCPCRAKSAYLSWYSTRFPLGKLRQAARTSAQNALQTPFTFLPFCFASSSWSL